MKNKQMLAFDLGASGGRAMLGSWDGELLRLEEIHRFPNEPVRVGDTLHWDILRLFHEMKQGMLKAKQAGGFDSVGVDTWGVDFGLLDARGNLLENPVHYRDTRTAGMLEEAFKRLSPQELYARTGNQFMEINTAFQLLSLRQNRPEVLERADALLLMPDLFNFFLCGVQSAEYTIASTTQLLNPEQKQWAWPVLEALDLPPGLLRPVLSPGTRLGGLWPSLFEELGIGPADVIAVAGHDTQSALAAVPALEKDFAFLSCGTWSLLGTELPAPLLTEQARLGGMTNEGACGERTSFLKNMTGLWTLQESRHHWARLGQCYSFDDMERMARNTRPLVTVIDPGAPGFSSAGALPEQVRRYSACTGQPVPQTDAEVIRCLYDSLVLQYRAAFHQLQACTGRRYDTLHMVGGGIRDRFLCQLTADACGCRVLAGPTEAAALGNSAVQLAAAGELSGPEQIREAVRRSVRPDEYLPAETAVWEAAQEKFRKVLNPVC